VEPRGEAQLDGGAVRLALIGGFEFRFGRQAMPLPLSAQRLTASPRRGQPTAVAHPRRRGPLDRGHRRAVIRAHLAEGNAVEARRQYELYRRLPATRLGMQPSASIFRPVHEGAGP
jgi:hypothetical protein